MSDASMEVASAGVFPAVATLTGRSSGRPLSVVAQRKLFTWSAGPAERFMRSWTGAEGKLFERASVEAASAEASGSCCHVGAYGRPIERGPAKRSKRLGGATWPEPAYLTIFASLPYCLFTKFVHARCHQCQSCKASLDHLC